EPTSTARPAISCPRTEPTFFARYQVIRSPEQMPLARVRTRMSPGSRSAGIGASHSCRCSGSTMTAWRIAVSSFRDVDHVLQCLPALEALQGFRDAQERHAAGDQWIELEGPGQQKIAGPGHIAGREVEAAEHAHLFVVQPVAVHGEGNTSGKAAEKQRL